MKLGSHEGELIIVIVMIGSSCTGSSGSVGRLADSPFPVASLCFPVQQKRY